MSIDEIRSHHLFEHFPRPTACATLAAWFSWLKPGGVLRIEVPDVERMARVLTSRFASSRRKAVAVRHIFGSHEADWAVHCEGYARDSLSWLLGCYGFESVHVKRTSWKGTHNIELRSKKSTKALGREEFEKITEKLLSNYLVDDSVSEIRLLSVWMDKYRIQVQRGWAG